MGEVRVDRRLFAIADKIAEAHVPRSWFGEFRRLVRKIKLRTDIYNALLAAQEGK